MDQKQLVYKEHTIKHNEENYPSILFAGIVYWRARKLELIKKKSKYSKTKTVESK